MSATGAPLTWSDSSKQILQGAKDVILSTKTMMLMMNAGGTGVAENLNSSSGQVAKDTKNLILLMFKTAEDLETSSEGISAFTKQLLKDNAKSLKSCVLGLIKVCKERVNNPEDDELKSALTSACKQVSEVLKDIMLVVQPQFSPPAPASNSLPSSPRGSVVHENNIPALTRKDSNDNVYSSTNHNGEVEEEEQDNDVSGVEDESPDSEPSLEGSDDGDELDFVVNALTVFGALDDLRGELKQPTRKTFAKKSSHVLQTATSLIEAAQIMKLSSSLPKLKNILDSLTQQIQGLQNSFEDTALRIKLDKTARDLEEAVGGCVDDFRALGSDHDEKERDASDFSPSSLGLSSSSQLHVSNNSSLANSGGAMLKGSRIMSTTMASPPSMLCPVFGGPLDTLIRRQRDQYPTLKVPVFFKHLIRLIQKSGLDKQGIFQVSVAAAEIEHVVTVVNSSGAQQIELPSDLNPHLVANLLKKFLACLPASLLSADCMAQLLNQSQNAQTYAPSIPMVIAAIATLPISHQSVLAELFSLLYEVIQASTKNKMTSDILANIFHPVLCTISHNTNTPAVTAFEVQVLKMMIENYVDVFKPQMRFSLMTRSNSDFSPNSKSHLNILTSPKQSSMILGGLGSVSTTHSSLSSSQNQPQSPLHQSQIQPRTPIASSPSFLITSATNSPVGTPTKEVRDSYSSGNGVSPNTQSARNKLKQHFHNLTRRGVSPSNSQEKILSKKTENNNGRTSGGGNSYPQGANGPAPPKQSFKICVVGDEAVGKTSFVQRLLYDAFVEFYEPTIEETYKKSVLIGSEECEIELLDISGNHWFKQNNYHKWFNWSEGFIIVYNLEDMESFKAVTFWLDEIAKARSSSSFPFIVISSHLDSDPKLRKVKRDFAENFLAEGGYYGTIHRPVPIIEYSAKTLENVDRIIPLLAADILVHQKIKKRFFGKKAHSHHNSSKKPRTRVPSNNSSKKTSSRQLPDTSLGSLIDAGGTNNGPSPISVAGHSQSFSSKLKGLKKKDKRPSFNEEDPTALDREGWLSVPNRSEGWIESPSELDLNQISLEGGLLRTNPGGLAAPPVVELISPLCRAEGYHIESWRGDITTTLNEPERDEKYPLECTHMQIPYYKLHFVGKEHVNYCGESSTEGPIVLSFILKEKLRESGQDYCKILLRTQKEEKRLIAPITRRDMRKDVLKYVGKAIPSLHNTKWTEVKDTAIIQQLASYEEKMVTTRNKFGVLLCLDGQVHENDMFGNVETTPELEKFLSLMGDKIQLKGWTNFRGGLDVTNDATGTHSYYTKFRELEVMFHVSTMLPYQQGDVQRVERKRHIGNDVVTIIFKQGSGQFNPSCITTHFTHIFCVVQVDDTQPELHYRVAFANRPGVRPYQPFLPPSSIIKGENPNFREFMLAKLINSERAALEVPEFKNKMIRTRRTVLDELVQKFVK